MISWLPSAHIAERDRPPLPADRLRRCTSPAARTRAQIVAYLPEVRPTWFFAVPRIWEKLKAGLEAMLAASPTSSASRARRRSRAARKVRLEQAGEPVPDELAAHGGRGRRGAVRRRCAQMLGLDEVDAVNVGAAPTPREVLEFFHAIGIPLAELWGMSETCGAGASTRPARIKIGTVGPPAPGVELKLAEDGELLDARRRA